MTVVGSANVLMSGIHRRWLTKREIMMVQGFPVDSRQTHGMPCSAFALREHSQYHGRAHSSPPSRRATSEQSGNSMHTAVSGICILFTLTQVIMRSDMMWLQHSWVRNNQRMVEHETGAKPGPLANDDDDDTATHSRRVKRARCEP